MFLFIRLEPNYASVEKKIYLNIVPFAHVFGYFSLILRITTGHILISLPQFKETQFLENIEVKINSFFFLNILSFKKNL